MRASVVIDNFNYAEFLPAAIDSALAQTHPDVEVVVVDDGSTDGSREVMARYGGRIRAVLQANGGQGAAIDAGWRACTGEVVCFLDADDVLAPGAIAAAARAVATGAAKVHWPLVEIDAVGAPLGRLNPDVPLPAGDLRARVLARGPGAYASPPGSGNAYARAFLERAMPVPPELGICADGWLYGLAPLFGPIARIDEPQASYRKHGRSWFGDRPFDERFASGLRVHEALLGALAERARELGHEPDEAGWRERSWYLRLQRLLAQLADHVPPGIPFALLDRGVTGVDATPARAAEAFGRLDGEGVALARLAQLADRGPDVLAVAWPAFGWLEERPSVRRALAAGWRARHASSELRLFDRRGGRRAPRPCRTPCTPSVRRRPD